MKTNFPRLSAIGLILASATTLTITTAHGAPGGWVDLFDGKTLKGWIEKNGTAAYRVENGTIVGKTTEGSPNSFLCTEKDYGDFELEFDVKIDSPLNSGVQLRSKTKETATGTGREDYVGRVYGPQVEIAASGPKGGMAGYIYGEATSRGWLTPKDRLKPRKQFKDGEWNHFRVVAQDLRLQVWMNGEPAEDLTDEEIFKTHPKGFIGLQVHAVAKGAGPYEAAWRNLRLRELPAK
jgi:hypothetical protein